jgi:hypothetical protein
MVARANFTTSVFADLEVLGVIGPDGVAGRQVGDARPRYHRGSRTPGPRRRVSAAAGGRSVFLRSGRSADEHGYITYVGRTDDVFKAAD